MRLIFLNLFWPAVVGNVAWAFFTVLVESSLSPDVISRLAALLLLSLYLVINWHRIQPLPYDDFWYWVADAAHLITIIVFAIAAQQNKAWLEGSLASIFIVTIIGHLFGAWEDNSTVKKERYWLAGANALGIGVIIISCYWPLLSTWRLPASIVIVLIAWAIVRNCILPAKENNPCRKT